MAGKVVNVNICVPLKQRSGLTGMKPTICHYSYNLPFLHLQIKQTLQMKKALILIFMILSFVSCKNEEIELTGQLKVNFLSHSGKEIKPFTFYIYPHEAVLIEDRTKWGSNIMGGRTDAKGVFLSEPLNSGNYVAVYYNSTDPSSELTMSFQIIAGEIVEFKHYID
jgi:hypothetical protein